VTIALTGANAFRFVSYSSPTPLSLAAPLLAAQPGTLIRTEGLWKQSMQTTGTFIAHVDQNVYSTVRQTAGSPQYVEHVEYQRDAAGNVAFSDTFRDGAGRPLWTMGAARAPATIANAASSQKLYSYSGTMRRFYTSSNGGASANFVLGGTTNGDGSGDALLSNADTGVATSFHLNAASAADVASNGIMRDGSGAVVATFTIDKTGAVQGIVGNDPVYGFSGRAISFGL
jgi:hypothetical protein